MPPPVTVCKHLKIQKKIGQLFCFSEKKFPPSRTKMVKRSDKTNTWEGVKGKKGKTVSDDAGGKSLSDTSTSTGVKSTVKRTSVNIFESSKRDKAQYFVDKVKDKRRTKNNNLEFDGLPHTIADYLWWRPRKSFRSSTCKREWRMLRETISRWELTTGTLLDSVNLH